MKVILIILGVYLLIGFILVEVLMNKEVDGPNILEITVGDDGDTTFHWILAYLVLIVVTPVAWVNVWREKL